MLVGMTAALADPAGRTGGTPLTNKSITLENPSKDHTYELYQIFTGTFKVVDGEDTLGDIAWGNGVTDAGKTALGTAKDVADAITDTAAGARAFANSIDQYLTNGSSKKAGEESLVWDNLSEGYYIIKDVTAAADLPEGDTVDLVVVQVLDNVTITAKSGTVEFDKKVADRNDSEQAPTVYDAWGNTSDYDVNDDVPYQVTIKLPANFSSYTTYQMTMHDDMEAGLSFNDDVVVTAPDGTALTAGTDYEVKKNSNGHTFEIAFAEVVGMKGAADNAQYTITYSAKLTGENVVYGNPGNHNDAWLTYSNNPTTGGEGGTTPHKTTVTFTYKLEVDKTDGTNPLPGAEFTLEKYIKSADGGTWTPLALIKNTAGTIFTFDGLDDGFYRITETATPAGYNSIDPIYFTVVAEHTATLDTLVVKQADSEGKVLDTDKATAAFNVTLTKVGDGKDAGLIDTEVVNNQGSTLPSTGGIGTTLFYIGGGILVLAAVILLVTKRRMNAND